MAEFVCAVFDDAEDEDADKSELAPVRALLVDKDPVVVHPVVPFSKPPFVGLCPQLTPALHNSVRNKQTTKICLTIPCLQL